jgi:hypothetical protein
MQAAIQGRTHTAGAPLSPAKLTLDVHGLSLAQGLLRLTPGAQLSRGEDRATSFAAPAPTAVRLKSIKAVDPSEVVTVMLSSMGDARTAVGAGQVGGGQGGWLIEDSTSIRDAPIRLTLRKGADLARLWPMIRSSGRFATSSEGTAADKTNLCFVRGREIVATMAGTAAARRVVPQLLSMLGGDLAYEGPPAALAASVQDIPAADPSVFVYNGVYGAPTYLVSHPFLSQSGVAKGFVDDTAAAVFRTPVAILAARQPAPQPLTN